MVLIGYRKAFWGIYGNQSKLFQRHTFLLVIVSYLLIFVNRLILTLVPDAKPKICYNNLMKKPIIYALGAITYIVLIVSIMNFAEPILKNKPDNIFMPITMLSLLVMSVAVMGFLFLSEPIRLYVEGQKKEAVLFFGKIVGFFACLVSLLFIATFIF
jgi:hypothetical protein